jgi:hypothetical protein
VALCLSLPRWPSAQWSSADIAVVLPTASCAWSEAGIHLRLRILTSQIARSSSLRCPEQHPRPARSEFRYPPFKSESPDSESIIVPLSWRRWRTSDYGSRECLHDWYNADGKVERCYHCSAEQPIRPEWRDIWTDSLAAAEAWELEDAAFRARVNRALFERGYDRFDEEAEAVVIAAWLELHLVPPCKRQEKRVCLQRRGLCQ